MYKLKWHDWLIISIAIIIILGYIAFSSGVFLSRHSTPLSNALFAVFNIILTMYVSVKFASVSFYKYQKQVAKTSIRHIRGYIAHIKSLEQLVEEKIKKRLNNLTKQYLMEIKNHLKSIRHDISMSEMDFKDIVNEEFVEENLLVVEINKDLVELRELLEKTTKQQKEVSKENKMKIKELEAKLIENIGELPFGIGPSGTISAIGANGTSIFGKCEGPILYTSESLEVPNFLMDKNSPLPQFTFPLNTSIKKEKEK